MTDAPVVVDASVVVTLLIDSGTAGEAVAARVKSLRLYAPAHLPVEVTNVVRRLRNAGSLTDTEASLAMRGLWSLPIELWPQEALSDRTWSLGQNFGSYDAAYVALAESMGGTLLTADARLSRGSGIACPVEVFG
jgi:predicted nucleic acid-binding protein